MGSDFVVGGREASQRRSVGAVPVGQRANCGDARRAELGDISGEADQEPGRARIVDGAEQIDQTGALAARPTIAGSDAAQRRNVRCECIVSGPPTTTMSSRLGTAAAATGRRRSRQAA